MDTQIFPITTLKKWLFTGVVVLFAIEGIALAAEAVFSILTVTRMLSLPSPVWIAMSMLVEVGTIAACLYCIVRFLQGSSVEAHGYTILAGVASLLIFFFSLSGPSWFSSFCALLSFVCLLSAENTLQKKPLTSSAPQKTPLTIPEAPNWMEVLSEHILPKTLVIHCDRDQRWRDKCLDQLQPFEAQGVLGIWDESRILAGAPRQDEMEQELDSAQVIILLVSACFLHSRFAQLLDILQRQKNRRTFWIYPVIVSPCSYELSPLCDLQPYYSPCNPDHKSLEALSCVKQKESLRDLAQEIVQRFVPPSL